MSVAYGRQRHVQIAEALASKPSLLCRLMNLQPVCPPRDPRIRRIVKEIAVLGLTLLVVEHDLHFLMKLSDRVTVLNFSKVLAEGSPLTVRNGPGALDAYRGSFSRPTLRAIAQ